MLSMKYSIILGRFTYINFYLYIFLGRNQYIFPQERYQVIILCEHINIHISNVLHIIKFFWNTIDGPKLIDILPADPDD